MIFKTFYFDRMAEAHLHIESGRTVGKDEAILKSAINDDEPNCESDTKK